MCHIRTSEPVQSKYKSLNNASKRVNLVICVRRFEYKAFSLNNDLKKPVPVIDLQRIESSVIGLQNRFML